MIDNTENIVKITIIVPVYNNAAYVAQALESVKKQGRDDIELIIVNDGSKDNSEEVISEFVSGNPFAVYISQENRGVSAARNAALDIARGEYIGFLDSDDVYTDGAVSDMIRTADEYKADLVIGESMIIGTFRNNLLKNSRKMSRKVYIDKYDTNLVYNFSVCNKIFRRDIIEDHHIRFQKIRHAEDGLFLFTYLDHCSTICGCPEIVYEYRKRVAVDDVSALKALNITMLESVLDAVSRIEELISGYPENFVKEFRVRALNATLINEYYRRLWILDDQTVDLLWDKISEYRRLTGEEKWELIVRKAYDLEMSNGLRSKDEIAGSPLISVILPKGLGNRDYTDLLKSLYYQQCPNFEVIADSSYSDITDEWYRKMKNFRLCSEESPKWADLIKLSKGRYIQIIDGPCVFDDRIFRDLTAGIYNTDKDFAVILIRGYKDGKAYINPDIEKEFRSKNKKALRTAEGHHDFMWMNKLVRREAMLRLITEGRSDSYLPDDSRFMYEELSFVRSKKNIIGVKAGFLTGRNLELLPRSSAETAVTPAAPEAPEKQPAPKENPFKGFIRRLFMIRRLREKYNKNYPLLQGRKILLIAPVYRGESVKKAYYDYEQLDISRIHDALGDEWAIVFRWDDALLAAAKKKGAAPLDISGHEKYAADLSAEDIRELLLISDALVADYSPVISEYEMSGRPVIYYWYDVNYYKKSHGISRDLCENASGKIAYTQTQLIDALKAMEL